MSFVCVVAPLSAAFVSFRHVAVSPSTVFASSLAVAASLSTAFVNFPLFVLSPSAAVASFCRLAVALTVQVGFDLLLMVVASLLAVDLVLFLLRHKAKKVNQNLQGSWLQQENDVISNTFYSKQYGH